VLVNRHRRKGGAADIADEGRGSSAFSGAVDVILTLRRKPGMSRPTIRELVAASRFDDTPEELIVELDPEAGYSALGTEQAIAALEAEQAVLEALSDSDAHGDVPMCTTKELTEITGTVRRTIERAVKSLEGAGMVKRVGEGGRKDPYRWVLVEKFDVHIAHPLRGEEVLRTSALGTGSASPLGAADSSAARPDHVEATWATPCRDYSGHQSRHRKTSAGWVCDICSSEGDAS
jgi:DNA-binding transcriptional ArsR family regulator